MLESMVVGEEKELEEEEEEGLQDQQEGLSMPELRRVTMGERQRNIDLSPFRTVCKDGLHMDLPTASDWPVRFLWLPC